MYKLLLIEPTIVTTIVIVMIDGTIVIVDSSSVRMAVGVESIYTSSIVGTEV